MKTTILKLVAMLCCMCLYVQSMAQEAIGAADPIVPSPNVILPSPQSQAFEKYINHAITEYNGLPEISIPLYEIEIKGLKIPIALSYHASGIQYWQNDGEIGAGWSLSVGGYRITWRINGKDDLLYSYYSNDSINAYRSSGNVYDIDRYLERIKLDGQGGGSTLPGFAIKPTEYIDGEHDLFTYMTPSTNGQFIITERNLTNSTYVGRNLEHKLDTILFSAENTSSPVYTMVGELRDENGFKYYFGGADDGSNFGLEGYWTMDGHGFITGWPLRTIQSPCGEIVRFDYEQYYCESPRNVAGANSLTITEAYCRVPKLQTEFPESEFLTKASRSWSYISASRNTTWPNMLHQLLGLKKT